MPFFAIFYSPSRFPFIGIAIWHFTISTFAGKFGLYVEDLFVVPQFRRHGHARALFSRLAQICLEKGFGGISVGLECECKQILQIDWRCSDSGMAVVQNFRKRSSNPRVKQLASLCIHSYLLIISGFFLIQGY
jgi:GNAT superfamily N-acetyltransferase